MPKPRLVSKGEIHPPVTGKQFERNLAAVLLVVTAVGFLADGLGLVFKQEWWRLTTIGAAGLSMLVYLLFWAGKFHELPDKGGVGILISLVILIVVFKYGVSSTLPVDLF